LVRKQVVAQTQMQFAMSIMQLLSRLIKHTLLQALALSYFTLYATGLAKEHLPYSELGGKVTDAVGLPGAFVIGILYPEGPHTDYGVPYWGYYVMAANLVFYLIVWYVLLNLIKMIFRRRIGHRR